METVKQNRHKMTVFCLKVLIFNKKYAILFSQVIFCWTLTILNTGAKSERRKMGSREAMSSGRIRGDNFTHWLGSGNDCNCDNKKVDAWVNALHDRVKETSEKIKSQKCKPNGDHLLPCETSVRECLSDGLTLLNKKEVKDYLSISGEKIKCNGSALFTSLKEIAEHAKNGMNIEEIEKEGEIETKSIINYQYQPGTVLKAEQLLAKFY